MKPKKKRNKKSKREKENMNNVQASVTMKVNSNQNNSIKEFATAMSNQVSLLNQQPEEAKGPCLSKSQELFKLGMGNFKCILCEESFVSKKEYERHGKTSIHKANRKRHAE